MRKALRGINLGGWLVAERWMTPELFEGVEGSGESSLVRELGYAEANTRLSRHRMTFITEEDFRWIAAHGFDFVRLPVGFWLFDKTDDFVDGEEYIDWAFMWAEKNNLKILLDFHGLQGSQNGEDHSGAVGPIWLYRPHNTREAMRTTLYMARKYGHHPALLGLEIINEPKQRVFIHRVLRYYDRLIPKLKKVLPDGVKIVVSDAFWPRRMARVLAARGYTDIVLDVHLYQNKPPFWRYRLEQFYRVVSKKWPRILNRTSRNIDILVGEWSAALPTKVLDAAGHRRAGEVKYYSLQKKVYDEGVWAHAYWTYKAPHNGPWDYRSAHDWLEKVK